MPGKQPKWPPGPYSMMEPNMVITGTADHLPYVLATVHEPMPGVNIQGDVRKTAQLFSAAPALYDALSFADILIETVGRKANNMGPVLAEAFYQAHTKAQRALAKARGESVREQLPPKPPEAA